MGALGRAADIADGVSVKRRRLLAHHTGLPSVHLYSSERVKPVTTRLPRLVARGYPADAPGQEVRDTFLRRIRPDGKPSDQDLYPPMSGAPAYVAIATLRDLVTNL